MILPKENYTIKDKLVSAHNIHKLRWNIGYVLQQIALFPHMTIAENIAISTRDEALEEKQNQNAH